MHVRTCGRAAARDPLLHVALLLLALALAARAETYPPGDYSDTGRVVRTARGDIELFDGNGCRLLLTKELQAVLAPHLGRLVRVDYTRVEEEGGLHDSMGAPIGRIRKVTRLESHVRVTVRPKKPRFSVAEPVRVQVTLENTGPESVGLLLSFASCNLLQDYHRVRSLEPESSEANLKTRALAPGESIRLTIESAWMVKAGHYDVVHTVPGADEIYLPSEPVRIEVCGEESAGALRAWLHRASPTQRIEVAERLLGFGDRSGVTVVLRLLDSPEGLYSHSPLYRFLWKHGGEAGEKRLIARLHRCPNQDGAWRIIESVYRSPRAPVLLERLLRDRRETSRDISGWCERPRICDITASWLAGYTDGAMKFPRGGTAKERETAVTTVRNALREDPRRFSVLR
jgi:hypothetical protein